MLCDRLPAGRISETELPLPGHEQGPAGALLKRTWCTLGHWGSFIHISRTSVKKRTFPDSLFWCFWREQCPGEGLGYTADCHGCPTHLCDSKARRELRSFQPCGFQQRCLPAELNPISWEASQSGRLYVVSLLPKGIPGHTLKLILHIRYLVTPWTFKPGVPKVF